MHQLELHEFGVRDTDAGVNVFVQVGSHPTSANSQTQTEYFHSLTHFRSKIRSNHDHDQWSLTMTITSVMPVQFCTFVIFNTYLFRVMWGAWKGIRGYGASAESKFLPHFGSQPASQDRRKKQVGLERKPTNRTAEATLRNNLWLLKRTSWNMIHLPDTIG